MARYGGSSLLPGRLQRGQTMSKGCPNDPIMRVFVPCPAACCSCCANSTHRGTNGCAPSPAFIHAARPKVSLLPPRFTMQSPRAACQLPNGTGIVLQREFTKPRYALVRAVLGKNRKIQACHQECQAGQAQLVGTLGSWLPIFEPTRLIPPSSKTWAR